MENYQQAIEQTSLVREESRLLALQIWQQRELPADNPALTVLLQESCEKWDRCAVVAVKLAPDLASFRRARKIAPEDGLAQVVMPNYLSERLEQKQRGF